MTSARFFALFSVFSLSFACDPAKESDTAEADTDDTEVTPEPEVSEPDDTPDPTAGLTGQILWADGSPASGVQMRLCSGLCFPATLDENGNFTYENKEATHYSLQAVKLGDATYPITSTVFDLYDDQILELEPWRIPAFSAEDSMSGNNTYTLDGGLTITGDVSGITAGIYNEDETTTVKSVFSDPSTAGLHVEGVDGDVVGIWYLGNFDLLIDPGWTIGGAPELGLAEGDVVKAYSANNAGKAWKEEGVLSVGADGTLTMTEGNGLSMFTTLILVK